MCVSIHVFVCSMYSTVMFTKVCVYVQVFVFQHYTRDCVCTANGGGERKAGRVRGGNI